jgi:hypothetical protein
VHGRIVLARSPRATGVTMPALLPPVESPAGAGGVAAVLRRSLWWAALGLAASTSALATLFVVWWPMDVAASAVGEYLTPDVGVVAALIAAAAWGCAYAVVDAIEFARRPASLRWYGPLLRWMHILGAVAVPTGRRRFLRAAVTAVPLMSSSLWLWLKRSARSPMPLTVPSIGRTPSIFPWGPDRDPDRVVRAPLRRRRRPTPVLTPSFTCLSGSGPKPTLLAIDVWLCGQGEVQSAEMAGVSGIGGYAVVPGVEADEVQGDGLEVVFEAGFG